MERVRQLLSYINARMSVLTVSQRIAIGLCAALIAGSVLWLLQWSTTPDLVPLVNQDFTFTELDAAEAALKSNGIRHETYGTRLFVRKADRHNALRLIHAAGALPEGSLFDMEAVVTSQNPFQAPEAREFAQNYAMGNELAKIIATSPSVRQASVIVNPKTTRRLGGRGDVPTASVSVMLAPGKEMTAEMVEGFAKLVAGAVSGLKPHNVSITDAKTLRSYNVPHPDEAVSFDYLRLVKQHEAHLRSKIQTKLADIPGVQVAVTVKLDTSKRVTQNIKHEQPQPKVETSQSSETTDAGVPAEAGVQANLGQALTAVGPGSGTTTEQTSVENFEPKVSQTETVEQMPFAIKSVTAAVGIPRSFVAAVFQVRFPEKEECKDDDPDFIKVRDEQVARVKASVERIAMAKDPADVQVDVYPDMDWTAAGPVISGGPATTSALAGTQDMDPVGFVRTYGAQLGLVFLALTSVFLMMRIIRKAPPIPSAGPGMTGEGADESTEEPLLTVGRRTIGQAEVSDTFLTGHEIDDDTLRYQELGREVSQLVADDPESAAHLIRRWIGEAT